VCRFAATSLTEYIKTRGQPAMETMVPPMLSYAKSTTSNVFIDLKERNTGGERREPRSGSGEARTQ
jgi:hypothetical protein